MIHRTIDPDLHKSTKHSILHTTNDFTKDTILMSSFGTFTPTDQSDYYKVNPLLTICGIGVKYSRKFEKPK